MPSPLQILADNTATVSIDGNPVATNPSTIGLTTPATIPGHPGRGTSRVDVHNNPSGGGAARRPAWTSKACWTDR
jgi:hypothetical protein